MHISIDLSQVADIISCISHYNNLSVYVKQLDPSQQETLNIIGERLLKHSKDKIYMDMATHYVWCDVNMHVISQIWSNTLGMYEGIGGAAMTSGYSVIIENKILNLACVYYGGKLMYIVDIDDKYQQVKNDNYRSLPGLSNVRKQLTTFYKTGK